MGDWQEWIIGVAAIAAASVTIWKVVLPGIRIGSQSIKSVARARDVLLGKAEVPDPDRPGELIQPAVPDLGVRITRVEDLVGENLIGVLTTTKESATSARESAAASAQSARSSAVSAEMARATTHQQGEKLDDVCATLVEHDRDIGRIREAVEGITGHAIPRGPDLAAEDG
jgi:hypothetical protein